jgi:acyl-CoA dehydrogenase
MAIGTLERRSMTDVADNALESTQSLVDGVFTPDHELFRQTVQRFIKKEVEPYAFDWETREGGFPREAWKKAAQAGFLGLAVPEEYGGPGCDALYSLILNEEMGRSIAGVSTGPTLFGSDLVTSMLVAFGNDAQKRRYLPQIVAGDIMLCAGITEPGAGSDVNAILTRARRVGDDYLISGQKALISNGMHADLCFLVAKTEADIECGRGSMTMFLVEMDVPGFERRKMRTMGEKAGSVAELFLDEVRVPASAILGQEGGALKENLAHLFTLDRVCIALRSLAVAELALNLTIEYTKNRVVFGKRVFDFQNTQFKLAELKAKLIVANAFKQMLLKKFVEKDLDPLTSSAAKLWLCELEFEVAHECLQLYGGYGYLEETPICRIFTYARLETLYAGTSEIQKGTIARYL